MYGFQINFHFVIPDFAFNHCSTGKLWLKNQLK